MTAPTCPFPNTCPVPAPGTLDLRRLRVHTVESGVQLHNVARAGHMRRLFNTSGDGSARFSPLTNPDDSSVGYVYAGSTTVAALLETTFHEVGPGRTNQIDVATGLRGRHQRLLVLQRQVRLADLRDESLGPLGVDRGSLVATTPAHYPCTREWAQRILDWGASVDGIIWNSRLAEVVAGRSAFFGAIAHTNYAEAMVIYNRELADRDILLTADTQDLASPHRRALVDTMANLLDVPIL